MKAVTHYLFSAGVSLGLLSLSRSLNLGTAILALWLSLSINYIVDALGHVSRDGNPTRTWLTHSIVTAPLWGAAVAVASITVLSQASGSSTPWNTLAPWTAMGALISAGHLFLDSLTQAGIYSLRRRIAIAHFRYDNLALNLGFSLLGALLLALTLGL